nr:EOG090X0FYC [Triops cancriformis]
MDSVTSLNPKLVILISGKRKSGKDYLTDNLVERYKDIFILLLFFWIGAGRTVVIRLSAPIKSHWAKSKNLDLEKLLEPGAYKEHYRLEMIQWGEETRSQDPGYFCRAAIAMSKAEEKPIWVVSDVRRKTDLAFFHDHYGERVKTVRVQASERTRLSRNWVFTPGIDDAASECNLDDMQNWDSVVHNDGDCGKLGDNLSLIVSWSKLI